MVCYRPAIMVLALLLSAPNVRGDDSDEVKRLKERIELLETKLKLAERDIEDLKKENASLRSNQPASEKPSSKKTLSERLPEGTVASGAYNQFGLKGRGETTLTVTGREGNKLTGTMHLKFTDAAGKVTEKEGNVEGEINGILLTLKTAGEAGKVSLTVSLRGNVLEGKWSSSAGGKGNVGFKLAP